MKNLLKWGLLLLALMGLAGMATLQAGRGGVGSGQKPTPAPRQQPKKQPTQPIAAPRPSQTVPTGTQPVNPQATPMPAPGTKSGQSIMAPGAVVAPQPAPAQTGPKAAGTGMVPVAKPPMPTSTDTKALVRKITTPPAKEQKSWFDWFADSLAKIWAKAGKYVEEEDKMIAQGMKPTSQLKTKQSGPAAKNPDELILPKAVGLVVKKKLDQEHFGYIDHMMKGFLAQALANDGTYDQDVADAMSGLFATLVSLDEGKETTETAQQYIADLYGWWYREFKVGEQAQETQPVQQMQTAYDEITMARTTANYLMQSGKLGQNDLKTVNALLDECQKRVQQHNGVYDEESFDLMTQLNSSLVRLDNGEYTEQQTRDHISLLDQWWDSINDDYWDDAGDDYDASDDNWDDDDEQTTPVQTVNQPEVSHEARHFSGPQGGVRHSHTASHSNGMSFSDQIKAKAAALNLGQQQ